MSYEPYILHNIPHGILLSKNNKKKSSEDVLLTIEGSLKN